MEGDLARQRRIDLRKARASFGDSWQTQPGEEALATAELGDMAPFERLLEVVSSPYDHSRAAPEYRMPAPEGGSGYQTYCGT